MPKISYRIGLDLGTNSLGWCIYRLDDDLEPIAIVRLGARIFSDGRSPKNLASLAQDRRLARQARRRRDRVLKRRGRILKGLVDFGLFPPDEAGQKALQELDPYWLRAKALDQKLEPHQIGRALYHLCRKRGFKSSRKDRGDQEAQKESGKVNSAIAALREKVAAAGARTVGEYLWALHSQRRPVRARRTSDGQYVLYLQRAMVAEEFAAIWQAQKKFHPELLTDKAYAFLLDSLLFQRPLKPVEPGRCQFEVNEPRARLSSPLQQKFRILQELNNLRLVSANSERALSLDERDLLAKELATTPELTFAKARSLLGISRSDPTRFNLESQKRSKLKGDQVTSQLASDELFGQSWYNLADDHQESICTAIATAADDEALIEGLKKSGLSLDDQQVTALLRCTLPDDFGSLSLKALKKIVPELEKDVITFDVAVQNAGYDSHSNFYTGEVYRRLPYYGEILRGYTSPTPGAKDLDERSYGKIANPTVHIGLNQLRQLLNAVIRRYGHPRQIVIEMAREFGLSGQRRREIEKEQADNQTRNEELNARLKSLGQLPTNTNRVKLRLWDELGGKDALGRACIYSGAQLSIASLFSDEVEVDHILPFSRSLHDGIGNKILCTRQANRDKGNRTPFEAFSTESGRYSWSGVLKRTGVLPLGKVKLFHEDALGEFLRGRDFIDRQLSDTAYLSRVAKQYLSAVCPPDRIWVNSGRLTGLLRGKWDLGSVLWGNGSKNRDDHRHHALDAAVIGACSRSLIQKLARAAERAEGLGANRLLSGFDLPWPGFRTDLGEALHRVIVSHKPDQGKEAALHNDTNYGFRDEKDPRGATLVGRRVPIESLTTLQSLDGVCDERLKSRLAGLITGLDGKSTKAALAKFVTETGIRRVLKQERMAVIPIRHRRTKEPYKYVKGDGNYCYEIVRLESGKWGGRVVSSFEANQPTYDASDATDASGRPVVMRLHRGDMVAITHEGLEKIMRIARISDGIITLAEHFEANVDARNREKGSGFKYTYKTPKSFQESAGRLVGVSILGYVNG